MALGTSFEAEELGVMSPARQPVESLAAGEVGYVVTGLKDVSRLRVGDTLTSRARPASEPLPGYQDVKPMVFAGVFPTDSDEYPELRDALERLKLNDGSLSYEPETSQALGFGFRCGFLGLLHMEIVRERLEREFDLDLLITAPNVAYQATTRTGETVEVHNPAEMPREIEVVEEPYVKASVIVPKDYVGAVMELANERRGRFDHLEYLTEGRVLVIYEIPLAEIVYDFYDQLKSRTRGYASFDYDLTGFREGDLTRVDILVGGEQVDALSLIVHRDEAYDRGRAARRAASRGDPPPALRRAGAGGDRVAGHRARDDQGEAEGRAREVLRRRHQPQAEAPREAEEGEEADEAGRRGGGAAGGVPRGAQPRRGPEAVRVAGAPASGVRHLYVHLPFCAHRCGYCDFVTVVGRAGQHDGYVDALLTELALERRVLAAEPLETLYLGGGTPTFTEPGALRRLLETLPAADEVTVEANPETVTPELAALLQSAGVDRVSLGAQSFQPRLLEVLERRASPEVVRRAVRVLRDAGFDNVSLDLVYGIPGQRPSDLDSDLAQALDLAPEHLSCYELEAKPGTRFTHAHGADLERQAEAMEGYFERVVETLTGAGYRWYETANFCLAPERAPPGAAISGRDTTWRTGSGVTTSGSGSGPSPRSAAFAGATGRASPGTSRRCEAVPRRRGRSSRWTTRPVPARGSCSGCVSTSRCRRPTSSRLSTATQPSGWSPAGSSSSVRTAPADRSA